MPHAESIENRDRRVEAIDLLTEIARLERDPGGSGYAEGMASRLLERKETVAETYVSKLRDAVDRLRKEQTCKTKVT